MVVTSVKEEDVEGLQRRQKGLRTRTRRLPFLILCTQVRQMMMMPFICSFRNKNQPPAIYPSFEEHQEQQIRQEEEEEEEEARRMQVSQRIGGLLSWCSSTLGKEHKMHLK